MRWVGLAKAKLQVHLAAIAYNIKPYWRMHALSGAAQSPAGKPPPQELPAMRQIGKSRASPNLASTFNPSIAAHGVPAQRSRNVLVRLGSPETGPGLCGLHYGPPPSLPVCPLPPAFAPRPYLA